MCALGLLLGAFELLLGALGLLLGALGLQLGVPRVLWVPFGCHLGVNFGSFWGPEGYVKTVLSPRRELVFRRLEGSEIPTFPRPFPSTLLGVAF